MGDSVVCESCVHGEQILVLVVISLQFPISPKSFPVFGIIFISRVSRKKLIDSLFVFSLVA